jgi:hypothetical protein
VVIRGEERSKRGCEKRRGEERSKRGCEKRRGGMEGWKEGNDFFILRAKR